MQFDIAITATQGARRYQEDSALGWPSPGSGTETEKSLASEAVAVLCDGMGGHAGGAVASKLGCEAFLPRFLEGEGTVRERLMGALDRANGAIARKVNESPGFLGMGSTLVAAHADADGLSWISVGDSLLYLYRQGVILLLNADHSLAPEIDKLAESGKISWEAARNDPRRHYLRSALTGDEIEMIDLSEQQVPLLDGDVVLLASDGLHTLDQIMIAGIVEEARIGGSAHAIAQRLVETVDEIGEPHQDNTTVVAICVRSVTSDV